MKGVTVKFNELGYGCPECFKSSSKQYAKYGHIFKELDKERDIITQQIRKGEFQLTSAGCSCCRSSEEIHSHRGNNNCDDKISRLHQSNAYVEARVNSNINSHRNRSLNKQKEMYENQVSLGQNYSMHSNSFQQSNSYQNSNSLNRSVSYQQNSNLHQNNNHRQRTHNPSYDGGPAYDVPRYESDYQYNYPVSPSRPADEMEVSVDSYEFASQRGGSQRNSGRSKISSHSGSLRSVRSSHSGVRDAREAQAAAGLTCNCEKGTQQTVTTYSSVEEAQDAGLTCNCDLGKQQHIIYDHAQKSMSSGEGENQTFTSSVSNGYDSHGHHMVSENKMSMSEAMMSNGHISHDGFSMMESGPELTSTPEPAEAIVEEERVNEDGTTTIIRRTVTATTSRIHFENQTPKIEVHISPATETIVSPQLSPSGKTYTSKHTHHSTTSGNYHKGDELHNTTSSSRYNRRSMNESSGATNKSRENHGTIQMEYSRSIDGDVESNQVSFNDNIGTTYGSMATNEIDASTHYRSMPDTSTSFRYEYNHENSINQTHMNSNDYNHQIDGHPSCYDSSQNSTIEFNREISQEPHAVISNENLSDATIISTKEAVVTVSKDTNERRGMSGGAGEVVVNMGKVRTMEKNVKISDKIQLTQLIQLLQSDDKALMSNAAGYIMHLVYNDDDAKRKIREVDLIPLLVALLDHDDEDVHRNAAGALKNLSYGQFMDDNKLAIFKCGGVEACNRLLHKTVWIEVREHVTGILYNISTVKEIKYEILRETLEAVSILVVIPLSGWEKESSIMGKKPGVITWSTLLRNSTGVLRNVSSAGKDARIKIRGIEGLLDALVWILRAGIADKNKSEINNKVIENIMCTLRNVSYKVDLEIDREVYLDAIKQSTKGNTVDSYGPNTNENYADGVDNYPEGENAPPEGKMFGCMGMKKKPLIKRINNLKGRFSLRNNKEQPPPEEWKYLIPVQEDNPVALGVELLWQPDLVTLYVHLITNSTNPITLEAAAGAIHNLCGCRWNWAGLHRIHIRLQIGIPPMHDLLTVDQEYVVRAVAYALRNMSIDATNKWSIGKFAYKTLLQVLPPPNATEKDTEPCGYTICTILSVLQVLVYKNYTNAKYVKDGGGILKLIALTREGPRDPNDASSLRLYSRRVVIEANRVLLYMWDFKECRDVIQQKTWSHSAALEMEQSYVTETSKITDIGDTYAHMKCVQEPAIYGRDLRRYADIEETENGNILINGERGDIGKGDEIEMTPFDNGEGVAEDRSLLEKETGTSKTNKKKVFKRSPASKTEKENVSDSAV